MKYKICLFMTTLIFLSIHFLTAQDFSKWKKKEVLKAKTAENESYLSDNEKQVIMLMNLARINGKKFYDTYMQLYLKRFNQMYQGNGINPDNPYLKSLKSDLKKTKNLPPYVPLEGLTKAARYHARDMGASGETGHESSNGMTVSERAEKFAGTPYVGENCSYGFNDPLYIVGQLLLDDGVPSLGHRLNILDKDHGYYAVGVAIEEHKKYRHNCVIDFAVRTDGSASYTAADRDMNSSEGKVSSAELGVEKHLDAVSEKGWDIKYAYTGGHFLKNRKTKNWREKTDSGNTFFFKESSSKDGQVILYDESRKVWLCIDTQKNTCAYSEDGSEWGLLYYLTPN